jgi:hypothetical protein
MAAVDALTVVRLTFTMMRDASTQHRREQDAVPDEVDPGDRHVVTIAFAAWADMIVTNNVRHFAPDRLAEAGLLVHTAEEFLVHQWWLDPRGVDEALRRWRRQPPGHR